MSGWTAFCEDCCHHFQLWRSLEMSGWTAPISRVVISRVLWRSLEMSGWTAVCAVISTTLSCEDPSKWVGGQLVVASFARLHAVKTTRNESVDSCNCLCVCVCRCEDYSKWAGWQLKIADLQKSLGCEDYSKWVGWQPCSTFVAYIPAVKTTRNESVDSCSNVTHFAIKAVKTARNESVDSIVCLSLWSLLLWRLLEMSGWTVSTPWNDFITAFLYLFAVKFPCNAEISQLFLYARHAHWLVDERSIQACQ